MPLQLLTTEEAEIKEEKQPEVPEAKPEFIEKEPTEENKEVFSLNFIRQKTMRLTGLGPKKRKQSIQPELGSENPIGLRSQKTLFHMTKKFDDISDGSSFSEKEKQEQEDF